ncbi:MAG: DUF4007 family protein [Armatimonadetes bacterium]|nr:DUF4007 family protein [Armatimonadota bacterium]
MPATLFPAAPQILPPSPTFAGHSTFALRSGWLKKGLDALETNGAIFNAPESLAVLGVGKNMVGAIRHWLLTTRLAREAGHGRVEATDLGRRLFADDGWDTFWEDEATSWLLHWQLTGPQTPSFTWAYTFNVFREWEWSRAALIDAVLGATHSLSRSPSRETVDRDVSCLLQCYAVEGGSLGDDLDCPLRALGLIRPVGKNLFRFQIEAKPTLPAAVFYYALSRFWNWKWADARTLTVWEICYGEGSPGQVFKLPENAVYELLDGLESATQGRLRFEDTAQTRQVVLGDKPVVPLEFLESFYAARRGVSQ